MCLSQPRTSCARIIAFEGVGPFLLLEIVFRSPHECVRVFSKVQRDILAERGIDSSQDTSKT